MASILRSSSIFEMRPSTINVCGDSQRRKKFVPGFFSAKSSRTSSNKIFSCGNGNEISLASIESDFKGLGLVVGCESGVRMSYGARPQQLIPDPPLTTNPNPKYTIVRRPDVEKNNLY